MKSSTTAFNAISLISELEKLHLDIANKLIAQEQSAYMRNQFIYHGIKKPVLAQVQKEWRKSFALKHEHELITLTKALWLKPQREYQYVAIELAQKHHKLWSPEIFELFEHLIRTKSWWDSVDTIASNLVGKLLVKYPELQAHMDAWILDENVWIRRTALIYQLKYKAQTNHEKLFFYCSQTMHEKEFFIRKAIGWALREYSKTDPIRVKNYIESNKERISALSIKEGSKYI